METNEAVEDLISIIEEALMVEKQVLDYRPDVDGIWLQFNDGREFVIVVRELE